MIVPSSAGIRVCRFGRTDLQVSELGLGCERIGGVCSVSLIGASSVEQLEALLIYGTAIRHGLGG